MVEASKQQRAERAKAELAAKYKRLEETELRAAETKNPRGSTAVTAAKGNSALLKAQQKLQHMHSILEEGTADVVEIEGSGRRQSLLDAMLPPSSPLFKAEGNGGAGEEEEGEEDATFISLKVGPVCLWEL